MTELIRNLLSKKFHCPLHSVTKYSITSGQKTRRLCILLLYPNQGKFEITIISKTSVIIKTTKSPSGNLKVIICLFSPAFYLFVSIYISGSYENIFPKIQQIALLSVILIFIIFRLLSSFGSANPANCTFSIYVSYIPDSQEDTGLTGNPYMFTGRRFDLETGLYYYRARYYNPYIGRFLQTDSIGYVDSMNLYSYCTNNPINCIDPTGNKRITIDIPLETIWDEAAYWTETGKPILGHHVYHDSAVRNYIKEAGVYDLFPGVTLVSAEFISYDGTRFSGYYRCEFDVPNDCEIFMGEIEGIPVLQVAEIVDNKLKVTNIVDERLDKMIREAVGYTAVDAAVNIVVGIVVGTVVAIVGGGAVAVGHPVVGGIVIIGGAVYTVLSINSTIQNYVNLYPTEIYFDIAEQDPEEFLENL